MDVIDGLVHMYCVEGKRPNNSKETIDHLEISKVPTTSLGKLQKMKTRTMTQQILALMKSFALLQKKVK